MPQYSLPKDRPRRDIKHPQRYSETDLIPYGFYVVEGIKFSEEPSTEVVNCVNSDFSGNLDLKKKKIYYIVCFCPVWYLSLNLSFGAFMEEVESFVEEYFLNT